MKRNYKKIILSLVLLTFSFVSFAQLPDPDATDPGTTDPPADINSKLILIAFFGLIFAYYQLKFKKRKV